MFLSLTRESKNSGLMILLLLTLLTAVLGDNVSPIGEMHLLQLETRFYACSYHFLSRVPTDPTLAVDAFHVIMENQGQEEGNNPRFCGKASFYEKHPEFCVRLGDALATAAQEDEGESFSDFCRDFFFGAIDTAETSSFLEASSSYKHQHKGKLRKTVKDLVVQRGFWWGDNPNHIPEADQRICLFLHGVGYHPKRDGFRDDQIYHADDDIVQQHWGDQLADALMPHVCKPRFYFTDTVTNTIFDGNLRELYCNAVKSTNAAQIFTHSFGNVIIASAMETQIAGCENIGKGDSNIHWYNSQGPLQGSEVVEVAKQICHFKANGWLENTDICNRHRHKFRGFASRLAETDCEKNLVFATDTDELLDIVATRYCARKPGYFDKTHVDYWNFVDGVPPAFDEITVSTLFPKRLDKVAVKYSSGSMCGISSKSHCGFLNGMKTRWGLEVIGAKLVSWDIFGRGLNLNDGFVGAGSCMLPGVQYGNSTDSPHTALKVSHVDGMTTYCHLESAKPIKWYKARALSTAKTHKASNFIQVSTQAEHGQQEAKGNIQHHRTSAISKMDPSGAHLTVSELEEHIRIHSLPRWTQIREQLQ